MYLFIKSMFFIDVVALLYSNKVCPLKRPFFLVFFLFNCRAGNEVKAGKSFTFWGLDKTYNAVCVVGLGEKNPKSDDNELICQEKEAVRVAASGKHQKNQNNTCYFINFQLVAKVWIQSI